MTEHRAADLPEGSVVANDRAVYIRTDGVLVGAEGGPVISALRYSPWRATNGGYFGDWKIDEELDSGAQVLRVGTGREE